MNPSNEGCIYRNQVFFAKENPFSIGAIRSFLFEATLAGPVASCCTRAPNFTCYLHVREPIVLSLLFGWVRCCTHLLVINSQHSTSFNFGLQFPTGFFRRLSHLYNSVVLWNFRSSHSLFVTFGPVKKKKKKKCISPVIYMFENLSFSHYCLVGYAVVPIS